MAVHHHSIRGWPRIILLGCPRIITSFAVGRASSSSAVARASHHHLDRNQLHPQAFSFQVQRFVRGPRQLHP